VAEAERAKKLAVVTFRSQFPVAVVGCKPTQPERKYVVPVDPFCGDQNVYRIDNSNQYEHCDHYARCQNILVTGSSINLAHSINQAAA
jgi:hypothetical protein